ncbi:MFS transporter [Nocardioides stalactiti]|uniref:MFS transporter n=1 Tax=Nocardioides stalactiti TaxID=2755356 RepID=UPI0016030305|nr:MFS transporter [Nocardioides stalactiti]
MSGLRSFWAALPTEGRWLLSTIAVQTLGRGLTLPFTIIYLHEVRGFDLGLSGTLMSLIAVSALVVTGPGGSLTDRFGARVVLLVGCGAMVVGNVLLAFATTPEVAALALVLIGINFGVAWPAFNSLIAAVVEGDLRQRYFGINFALVNLGIGVGGVVGGLYVDVSEPGTFTTIFLIDAASALIPAALLVGPLRHVSGRAEHDEDDVDAEPASYRAILRRPAVLWLTGLTFIAMFVGYGQFEAGLPGYARQVAEVSTQVIGVAFAVNAAVIVLLQFAVLNRISGRRRTRVIVVMSVLWAAAWMLVGGSGLVPGTALAAAGLLSFMGVFALGETLLQPTVPAISNDLATDRTRGRSNAINAAAFQGGAITGPAAAGFLLEHDLGEVYVAIMLAGCAGIAVMALALERRMTPEANGIGPVAEPAEA